MIKKKIIFASMIALALGFIGCGSDNDSTTTATQLVDEVSSTATEDGNSTFAFTKDYLNGKTLYLVEDDDFGYDGLTTEWNMVSMSFTDTEMTWQEIDLPDDEPHTFSYTIENGSIVVTFEEDGEIEHFTITPVDTNGTVMRVNNDGEMGYIFSSEQEAKAFRDAKNAESTMSGFTTDYLKGKRFYYVVKSDLGYDNLDTEWNMVEVSFSDTEMTWKELFGNEEVSVFPYTIDEDGSIVATWTDGDESGTLVLDFISSNSRAIHVNLDNSDGYFFEHYEEEGLEFMNRQNGVEEED